MYDHVLKHEFSRADAAYTIPGVENGVLTKQRNSGFLENVSYGMLFPNIALEYNRHISSDRSCQFISDVPSIPVALWPS